MADACARARTRMCVVHARVVKASRRRDGSLVVKRRACAIARVQTLFLFPSKIDGKAAGRRDRAVLIYKRRGMTLPIIKLAVLLSLPRDKESCGKSRGR